MNALIDLVRKLVGPTTDFRYALFDGCRAPR